jgi:hypothetical protein
MDDTVEFEENNPFDIYIQGDMLSLYHTSHYKRIFFFSILAVSLTTLTLQFVSLVYSHIPQFSFPWVTTTRLLMEPGISPQHQQLPIPRLNAPKVNHIFHILAGDAPPPPPLIAKDVIKVPARKPTTKVYRRRYDSGMAVRGAIMAVMVLDL